MKILQIIAWPIIVSYRTLEDIGDFFSFWFAFAVAIMVAAGAVAGSETFPSHLFLICILTYVLCLPVFTSAENKDMGWAFPHALICNIGSGIIWAVAIAALFYYWPV